MRTANLFAGLAVVSGLTAFSGTSNGQNDWPTFRGPDTTGYIAESNPPTRWSETENIAWKTELPGLGYSSPIVADGMIFVTTAVTPKIESRGRGRPAQAPEGDFSYHVLAIEAATGDIAWNSVVSREAAHEGIHPTGSYASPSCVVGDGMVYAFFGSRGLFALGAESGEVAWSTNLGDMNIILEFGEASSPAIHDGTIIVPWDHQGDSSIAALDARTGDVKWRKPRNETTNWTTPAIAVVNGKAQAIMTGENGCIAYDVETGDEVWRSPGLTPNTVPVPIVMGNMAYLMSGFQGAALQAIDLSKAKGEISEGDGIVFTFGRGTPYVPSPVLADGQLYFLRNYNGQLTSIDAETGALIYRGKRLDSVRNVYSSMVGGGGYLFVSGREGDTAVIKTGPEFELVRTNTLDAGINATPAIVGDRMFLRTDTHLYCITQD